MDNRGPTTLIATFRHSGWQHDRARVLRAMIEAELSPNRRAAFGACGSNYWLQRHVTEPTMFRLVSDKCHDRFCLPCGNDRRAIIQANLNAKLTGQAYRFLTLTIRHHDEPLKSLLDHLLRSFRRLRTRQLWRDRVTGGVAFLEVKYNPERKSWHPHLHCVLEGRYIPAADLRTLWLAATGDSHDLALRYVRDARRVSQYVSKYATKPLDATIIRRPNALREAIDALHGRRLLIAFGTWRHWRLLEHPDHKVWTNFGHLNEIKFRASNGDDLCQRILGMMITADEETGVFHVDCDHLVPDT